MNSILSADSIGKRFGANRVLTSASLVARCGSITALVGRNGAGKSTLLRICSGWMRPDYGTLTYRDRAYTSPTLHRLAGQGLCFLPAEQPLLSPSFRLGEQLQAVARQCHSDMLPEIVDRLRLTGLLGRRSSTLSTGERRRASFAVAELIAPQCLLADEPLRDLAPLDAEIVVAALRSLRSKGCGVVVTGHNVSAMFAVADEIVWIVAGTTLSLGTPEVARENWQFRREFLGSTTVGGR